MDVWLGVELRHLSVLAAIGEERSFRGAADRLGYVQSAVSQRIAQLESAVGMRLVERTRGHRHVELTEAGKALLRHAQRIQEELDAARADLRSLTEDGGARSLRVGAFGSFASRLLPGALALLAQRMPRLRVETREAPSDRDLFPAVQSGELDAAFAELPLERGCFRWRELLVDPLVLVVPRTSPLALAGSPPSLAQIAAQPLIVDPTWRRFKLVEAELTAAGLQPDVRATATSNAALQAFAASGLGVAMMSRLAVDPADPDVAVLDLSGIVPARPLVCYWSEDRTCGPVLDPFLNAMHEVCAPYRVAVADRLSTPLAA